MNHRQVRGRAEYHLLGLRYHRHHRQARTLTSHLPISPLCKAVAEAMGNSFPAQFFANCLERQRGGGASKYTWIQQIVTICRVLLSSVENTLNCVFLGRKLGGEKTVVTVESVPLNACRLADLSARS